MLFMQTKSQAATHSVGIRGSENRTTPPRTLTPTPTLPSPSPATRSVLQGVFNFFALDYKSAENNNDEAQ